MVYLKEGIVNKHIGFFYKQHQAEIGEKLSKCTEVELLTGRNTL